MLLRKLCAGLALTSALLSTGCWWCCCNPCCSPCCGSSCSPCCSSCYSSPAPYYGDSERLTPTPVPAYRGPMPAQK
jgi:hypothetical protein